MTQNTEPEKWREGIDPFTLPLQSVQIQEILGYPHAANQVFYLRGLRNGQEGYYYLKYAAHMDANLQNEVEIIRTLHSPLAPKVVEYDAEHFQYELTEQIEGKRLSIILKQAGSDNGLAFMREYGKTLAVLHQSRGAFPDAPHRRFHTIPERTYFAENGMENVYSWLWDKQPRQIHSCFVHGDFHFANILWDAGHISGILDFELAGMGNREFDVAWSLILRPGQNFMKTKEELREFLLGYTSLHECDYDLVLYYMVLIYSRFLKLGDTSYESYVRAWMNAAIQDGRQQIL